MELNELLPAVVANVVRRNFRIETIEELRSIPLSSLLKARNLGPKRISLIQEALKEIGKESPYALPSQAYDEYFTEPQASELESMREKAREAKAATQKGRITFDCYNAIYPSEGNRVKCKLGYKMSNTREGTMELASVLAGRTGFFCRRCSHFEG